MKCGQYLATVLYSVCLVGILGLHYRWFYVEPSFSTVLYVQTVTFTRQVPPTVFVSLDPYIPLRGFCDGMGPPEAASMVGAVLRDVVCVPLYRVLFTHDEWSEMVRVSDSILHSRGQRHTMQAHLEGAVVGTSSSSSSSLVPSTAAATTPNEEDVPSPVVSGLPPSLKHAPYRIPSKHHVNHQLQEVLHYPVAYYVCVHAGLCDACPLVTPSMISVCHVCIAISAAICFYKASHVHITDAIPVTPGLPGDPASASAYHEDSDDTEDIEADGVGLTAVTTPTPNGFAVQHHPVSVAPLPPTSMSLGLQDETYGRGVENGGLLISYDSCSGAAAPFPGAQNRNNLGSLTGALVAKAAIRERRWWVVLGALLFGFRNFLDAFDGVVARYRMQQRFTSSFPPVPTPLENPHGGGLATRISSSSSVTPQQQMVWFGWNGHTMDTLCDFFGGTCCCVGILLVAWSQPVVVWRWPRNVLVWLRLRASSRHQNAKDPRWVAFASLFFVPLTAAIWDMQMIRYVNLFDAHANASDALFALERTPMVRWNQFLLALSSADCVFTVLGVALLLDRLWQVLQAMLFVGFPWLVALFLQSQYTWHTVVAAARAAGQHV